LEQIAMTALIEPKQAKVKALWGGIPEGQACGKPSDVFKQQFTYGGQRRVPADDRSMMGR
jgi:hypothetical protein